MSAFGSLSRVSSTDQRAEIGHSVVFFQDGSDDWAGGHVVDQLTVEGAFGVNSVELTSVIAAQLREFHSHDAETSAVDFFKDSTDVSVLNSIWLDHGKSAIAHNNSRFRPRNYEIYPHRPSYGIA